MPTPARQLRNSGVAAVLSLPGCSDSEPTGAEPTVPRAASSSTTPTTVAVDVSVVPETIDEPYLDAVLAALDEVDGQATRIIYDNKRFTPEAADLLDAIYGEDAFQRQFEGWLTTLVEDPELKGILPDPGSRRTTVERVLSSAPSCLWLAVKRDYPRVAANATLGPLEYVALEPLDPSSNPKGHNPTAWMLTADGYREDGTEPSDPCPAG